MNGEDVNRTDIRTIYKSQEFEQFYDGLSSAVKVKFEHVFNVIQTVYALPIKFVKRLVNTDLYEMRVSVGTNEYRTVLFAIDHDNIIQSTRVILLNGFLKKSEKDYRKQIEIAKKILKDLES
jgi:phage-related protein